MTTSPTPTPAPLSAEEAAKRLRSIKGPAPVVRNACDAADLIDTLTARVAELEAAEGRWKGTVRELSAACQKRAQERDDARGANDIKCMIDLETREAVAGALGMSWDGCDPFKWPELIARANELRTTLKMRPDWKARATQAEAALAAAEAREAAVREALTEARSGLFAYTGGADGACGDTIARIDAALAKARASGLLPTETREEGNG